MSVKIGALILAGLFALLEVYASITEGRARRSRLPMLEVVTDPVLGFRPVPGHRHFVYEQPVTLNALGLRGAVPWSGDADPAPARESAIIALGESQLYGMGVADEHLATAVAERELRAQEQAVHVVNAGVRAYSLAQQAMWLEELLDKAVPRGSVTAVVVFVYPYSVRNHRLRPRQQQTAVGTAYVLDLGGPAEGRRLAIWRLKEFVRLSAAVTAARYRYKEWRRSRTEWGAILRGAGDPIAGLVYQRTGQAARHIAKLCAQHGARLHFVALPAPSQLREPHPPLGFQAWVRDIASRTGAGYTDLRAPLRQLYRQRGRLPVAPYDDHFDAAAHRVMAQALKSVVSEGQPSAR